LEAEAARTGSSPASVAQDVLRKIIDSRPSLGANAPRLAAEESRLLEEINHGPTSSEMERYLALIARRQSESLGEAEAKELLSFTQRMEQLAVTRMRALVGLAALRGMDVESLMAELQILPPDVIRANAAGSLTSERPGCCGIFVHSAQVLPDPDPDPFSVEHIIP